jgi:HAMP domain-containing protein
VHDRDRAGGIRVRCAAFKESGTCSNGRRYSLERIERAVLDGMKEQLRHPQLIETYIRTYNAERQRLAASAAVTQSRLTARLSSIANERDRIISLVVKAVISEEHAKTRLEDLSTEEARIRHELAKSEASPNIIRLHPAALDRYLATIGNLSETLGDHGEAGAGRGSVVEAFRALVQSITVHVTPAGMEVEVRGRLASLIGGRAFPEAGHFGNLLTDLVKAELIERRSGSLALTEEGRKRANPPKGKAKRDVMVERIKAKISGPAGKILDALVASYPHAMSREALGEATGLKASAGHFGNLISELAGPEIVERTERGGDIRLADWVMLR